MAAETADGRASHHRAKGQELIHFERGRWEGRGQERWRREKTRSEYGRGFAWEKRKRDERRGYFQQRIVVGEEARTVGRANGGIRRMEALGVENEAATAVEDGGRLSDGREWRKAGRFRAGNRWGSGHSRGATSVTKAEDRSMSRLRARYLIYNELNNMELKVVARVTARVHGPGNTVLGF